jgi:hypothetical protein
MQQESRPPTLTPALERLLRRGEGVPARQMCAAASGDSGRRPYRSRTPNGDECDPCGIAVQADAAYRHCADDTAQEQEAARRILDRTLPARYSIIGDY